MLPAGKSGEIV